MPDAWRRTWRCCVNNAVLIQQVWEGAVGDKGDYLPLMELTKARNEAYCARHAFDFVYHVGTLDPKYASVWDGCWPKVELIQQALRKGYQYIVWMDPDALIRDLDTDLRDACPLGIGACWMRIPQLDHWNVGVLYLQNTPEVVRFVDEWLAQFPGDKQWREQGVFNAMGMKSKVVFTIADRWNATMNYSMVPDAVVLGFHGNGDAPFRLSMMQETLKHLPEESSKLAQGFGREVAKE